MQLSLLDNALDSLEWTLKHLGVFLKKDPYFENRKMSASDLKQAIINLNGCLELLFKKLISDINEALIFDFEKSNIPALQFYRDKLRGSTNLTMYDYFIENNAEIYTISYNKCIDYFCDIYEIGPAYKNAFNHLRQIRNSIMHLGIDYKHQYYILVEYLEKVLWLIQNELLPKLGLAKDILTKKQSSFLPVQSAFADISNTLWKQLYGEQINSIADKLEEAFNDIRIKSYLSNIDRKIDFGATNDMEHCSAIMFVQNGDCYEEILAAYHDPLTRSLQICDEQENARVFAIFALTSQGTIPSKFYCCKDSDGVFVSKIDHQSEFWLQSEYKNSFYSMDYKKECLIGLIEKMIGYCRTVEFIDCK